MISPAPKRLNYKHAFGVDETAVCAFLFPVPFSGWVSSIKPYWIILTERRSGSRILGNLALQGILAPATMSPQSGPTVRSSRAGARPALMLIDHPVIARNFDPWLQFRKARHLS